MGEPSGEGSESRKGNRVELWRAFALPVVIGLVVLGFAGVNFFNGLADKESKAAPPPRPCEVMPRADLAPATGALFGVNLDWHSKPLSTYAQDLGHKPAVSVSFTGFPLTTKDEDDLQNAVEQIRADGHMMLLTLEPRNGLDTVTVDTATALAHDLARFNNEGVPVVVRFAHEMNGSWYAWSQQPQKYVHAFQTLATAVHTHAPGSAMMWAPNYGGGYPFAGGQYEAKPGTPDFVALDTSGDGTLSMNDDAYAPYYPGDEAVDWVGMSLYHWGSTYPWGENELPEADKFADQLTGNYVGANGDDSLLADFYGVYGTQHGKPVAIPETAALFAPGTAGASEMAIKEAWWNQLFSSSTHERFPNLKMINWFEWDKNEIEVKGRVDWTVTNTPAVRDAFTAALPGWLRYGPTQTCQPPQ
ncbi:glycosyl hydrolase (plasmid) [Paenarthrobacter sp. OM7]|uniref:glycoside hydrolase family 26 protein n=1 Tax=Paenarthrobacter sp. OM7 TaxID=3041264 RepID=UPI0024690049|nr:glycosyl hydrolase [Paenarthrobacter sp. OM7]WGM22862.1 glycosyl hydrolase [Paenarthrobacter sp. OM7]